MTTAIDRLFTYKGVKLREPAPKSDIDAVVKLFETAIPKNLISLWEKSNGIALEAMNAHMPSPAEIISLVNEDAWGVGFAERGFVPILDDHESNLLVMAVYSPLAFRVLHLPHDDAGRLIFRNLDSFIDSLFEAMQAGASADMFYFEPQGDYSTDEPRSKEDQDAAHLLMAMDGDNLEWNYAVQLLDASDMQSWAKLLETDHFVRRDVVVRMQQMTDPKIRELLQQDQANFEKFTQETVQAAREAGLKVGTLKNHNLQIGGKWLNLEAFFHRRHIPDAIPRMINWFKDVIAGRNPQKRAGHFMAD